MLPSQRRRTRRLELLWGGGEKFLVVTTQGDHCQVQSYQEALRQIKSSVVDQGDCYHLDKRPVQSLAPKNAYV